MRGIGGWTPGVAALAFAASAVVLGATVVRAVRTEGLPVVVGPAPPMTSVLSPSGEPAAPAQESPGEAVDPGTGGPTGSWDPYPRVSETEILGAVNQDLFTRDRTPPLTPYLLPSERTAFQAESTNGRRQREPNLRVVGTALYGDLALAMIQLEDTIPLAFVLGETVEGYTLASITQDGILLTGEGAEFTFPVTAPDRSGSSSDRGDRNTRNNRGNSTEDAARALTERVQQMLQGLQGRGMVMPGQGGNVSFQFQPGAAIERLQGVQLPGGQVILRGRGGGGGQP